ncbi:MAG: Precorrin-4 C11-methyltransferase [Cenarchaeum symbiont of Oopsacas minuta]|nr:Precorrin-4 C11-methyltransferase [Cenarchaeum symbiont of Oopsacas minuta]
MYFVGCGPGDPDLITVKAKKIIQKAQTVVYSGSLIPPKILKMCRGQMHDASGMIREEINDILSKSALAGKTTVRLHDGDPSIYGAIREQMDLLKKKKISSEIVPGITSFLAAAAALGTQLTLPGITQSIIVTRAENRTKVSEKETVEKLAKHGATMVFYLSVHLLDGIVKQALKGAYKKDTPAAIVYRASWEDEKVIRGTLDTIVSKVRKAKITRTAIIVIGGVVDPKKYEFSKLYDKNFSHGYRRASITPKKKRDA